MNKIHIEKEMVDEGEPFHAEVNGKTISVFYIDGKYVAYSNWCPHQGGPACEGRITGTTDGTYDPKNLETTIEWVKDGQILVCPWHTWEFDIRTGKCTHNKKKQLRSYEVIENDEDITVIL